MGIAEVGGNFLDAQFRGLQKSFGMMNAGFDNVFPERPVGVLLKEVLKTRGAEIHALGQHGDRMMRCRTYELENLVNSAIRNSRMGGDINERCGHVLLKRNALPSLIYLRRGLHSMQPLGASFTE